MGKKFSPAVAAHGGEREPVGGEFREASERENGAVEGGAVRIEARFRVVRFGPGVGNARAVFLKALDDGAQLFRADLHDDRDSAERKREMKRRSA